jgi:adenylate cyclase class IV
MPTETEVKIRLDEKELDGILHVLGKPKFQPQKNIFYRLDGCCLRERHENGKIILTFKGKRTDNEKLNIRSEIEISFKNNIKPKIGEFFSYSGSAPFSYTKYRASFRLNNCDVYLDILPNKEKYIEIEGKEGDIMKNMQLLGLNEKENEKRSYLEILSS